MKARIFADENKKWWTLGAVAFGLFMIMLDNTIVNVALPAIEHSLHMSISSLEWIVTAYALTFAALLITGGKLGDMFGRRKMFVVGIVVSYFFIRESRDTSHEQSIDLPGLVASGGALLALSYALIDGNTHGWTSPEILGLFVGAAVLLAVFIQLELRQRLPMLDLSLFKIGSFVGANLVAMLVSLGMFGVFFYISLYVQNVLGYSPTKAGAIFLPMTILIILVAPIAGKLSDRVGSRWLMGAGMSILGVSLLLYQRIGLHTGFWSLLPQLLLGGLGMALTMSPMTSAAMGSVPIDKAGVRPGVLNSFRQMGGSLGIALMGAILLSYEHPTASTQVASQQFVDGLHAALLVSAVIAFAAAAVAIVLLRTKPAVERAHIAEAELAA